MPASSLQQVAELARGLVRPGGLPRPLAAALALCLAAVIIGLAWPVARPQPPAADVDWLAEPPPAKAGSEDLSAFLASQRWGVSLAEARRTAAGAGAGPATVGINPALAALGFVGVTAIGEAFAALVVADGATVRLRPGDILADGQTLAAIDANTATLRGASGEEQVLVLFPPVSTP